MFVKQQKRKDGRIYLSVVEGYRDESGKTKTRHVRSLGYLDKLEKLYDDPIAHFKAEVEAENEAAKQDAAPIKDMPVVKATGTRPSAEAVSEALANMVGHRLDANIYHFDYRTDLTDALCDAVGIDLSRQIMTKSQMNKVMSVVKKPRS